MSDLVSRLTAAFDRAGSLLGGVWRPTELAGCRIWLRASSGVSRVGPLVRAWRDRASGLTLRAPSLLDAPTLVERHPALGDRPALRFAAPGEHLAIETPRLGALDAFSLFVVLVPEGVGASTGFALSLSQGTLRAGIRIASSNELSAWQGRYVPGRVCLLADRPYVVGLIRSDTHASLWLDGAVARRVSARPTSHEGNARFVVGAPRPVDFRGAIAEVVSYDRALERAEIERLMVELSVHYALPRPSRRPAVVGPAPQP